MILLIKYLILEVILVMITGRERKLTRSEEVVRRSTRRDEREKPLKEHRLLQFIPKDDRM